MPEPGSPSDRWGYVGHVYVVPAERSRGVGAALMEALLAWSRSEGLKRLILHPRERSVPFYERLGFRDADLLRLRLRP
jgi:GNAT superfamily N-acetyltransferase